MRAYLPSFKRISLFSLAVFLVLLLLSASPTFASVTITTPTDYTVAQLDVGDEYYLDRTYTVTSIPIELATGTEEWIKTKNNDKYNTTSSDFLQFTISQDSIVYVAYDSRATSLPNWLSSNFTMTSLTIGVTDSDMGHFDVYQQTFTAGTVSLGGNLAVPASGAGSNYIVIVQPTTPVVEICDNSLDDDGDSLIDCADPDCSTDPACQTCTDADFDTFFAESGCGTAIDCDDTDFDINPGAAEICNDTIDNDCDNLIDCNDGDCFADPACSGGNVNIITPADYTVAQLNVGDEYYLDRTYTVASIPPELATGAEEWIKTQNSDKSNTTSSDFLQFTISQDSTVYVAYDSRATSLPNWLSSNFTMTSLTIGVTDSDMGHFDVYQQTFTAGTVSLGGNLAVPASGAGSNYIVIVQPTSPVPPVTNFSGTPTSGVAPLLVSFSDSSSGDVDTWLWDFGDTGTSTLQNPSHTYNSAGDYTVTLQVTGSGGSDTAALTDYITVTETPTPPSASFSGTPVSGVAPLIVSFSDSSSGDVDTWSWTFGDGGTSTAQDPSHTYNAAGDYTVTLQVTGPAGSDTATLTDYISVTDTPTPPSASFSGTPVSGVAPLLVSFSDSSSGDVDTWLWDFGDTGTSTLQNPSHTYNSAGDYTVTLQVTGPAGSDTATLTDYITVTATPTPPSASFSGTPVSGVAPLLVSFSDSSSGDVDTWSWSFGDGGTSTAQHPSYTYNTAGDYTVTLQVTGPGGSDTATLTDYITVTEATGNEEHIYIAYVYANPIEALYSSLQAMGASQEGDVWTYTNYSQNKQYIIHPIGNDVEALKQALMTQDAHVMISGHANYGLGPIPATTQEKIQLYINDIYYIDDPRILNVSSMRFGVSVSSLINSQAYPNWQPVFQDGTSGIMPFCFWDPKGPPPYNYWISYQIPGDSTYYRVDPPHYLPMEREPGCGSPAWYSPNRKSPDPTNPNERQYFINNLPLALSIGNWITSQAISGYYDQDYLYKQADPLNNQDNEVRWVFKVPQDGNYSVTAFWPASPQNTTNAQYSVFHAGDTTTVAKNQTINGGQWNELGVFSFIAGDEYAVILTDNADAGNVVADAVRITHASDPGILDEEIDNLTYPRYHYSRKTILFLKELGIKKEDMKFKRLFYNSCQTGKYYLDTLGHGIVWYSVQSVAGKGAMPYLINYMNGKSDEEIWEIVNSIERFYDYYDFSKLPSEQ